MKQINLVLLFMIATAMSVAQTASDFYMPVCVGNQTVLRSDGNLSWIGRNTTYTFTKEESIAGGVYTVEAGIEYPFNTGIPHGFHYLWLRETVNGEIMIRAYSNYSPNLDSAVVLPVEAPYFSNYFLTVGFSVTNPVGPDQIVTDSVISITADFGIFHNCIQIREIVKINGVITITDDKFYAEGIGLVGDDRLFPLNEVHTDVLVSTYVTGCEPVVDSILPNTLDTCLGTNVDCYVNNILTDTLIKTVTVTWNFQDGTQLHQFIQTYNFQVYGNNVIGITIQCNGKSVKTYYRTIKIGSGPIGINEPGQGFQSITIYPNPVAEVLFLRHPTGIKEEIAVSIYNAMGVMVKAAILDKTPEKINVGDLKEGIYLVKITTKGSVEKQRLIIQR